MNDLLKVLDMSEDEQWKWLEKKYGAGAFHSFATLAFRLRDEVYEHPQGFHGHRWRDAKKEISKYLHRNERWFDDMAKPIHWIIAALKAKEEK